MTRASFFVVALALWVHESEILASSATGEPESSVGAPGQINQLVLPGTELVAKPLEKNSPIVLRIVNVWPHGDRFRYDILYSGMEPGRYDLAEWLVRKDGSETSELPEIPVVIHSLLPPGQVEPNDLDNGWLPRLGGYRTLLIGAIVAWSLVLAGLIFVGRHRKSAVPVESRPLTLADLLSARLAAARDGRLKREDYAELERMLFSFWRQRLQLESVPPDEALRRIRADERSGPLMTQLERWMHGPRRDLDVDLAGLLEPYRSIPFE